MPSPNSLADGVPMQDLVTIDSRTTRARISLAVTILIVLIGTAIAVKWQIGNMLGHLTDPTADNALGVADLAVALAPADPKASWLDAASEDDLAAFERTVQLAPFDYRWRVEHGRALEQDGQFERAEAEFKKAVDLAPGYAYPRWNLGNYLLRRDRPDEALAELRKAAEGNTPYREQVFALAWEYFDGDLAKLEYLAGETVDGRARLAYFLAGRGRAEESLRYWNKLTEPEKQANPEIARTMAHGFFERGNFPESLEFSRQLGFDPDARPEAITNASFDKGLGELPDARFDWMVTRADARLDISTDSKVKRDGARSVRLSFRNFTKPELYNLTQTVVVRPAARYSLSFWVRTENLKSGTMPKLEIINANDNRLLVSSAPFPAGTTEWQEMRLDLAVPANCNGIRIRTARIGCGEECPITGVIWYDDLELKRVD